MENECMRIQQQLTRSFAGPAWHGPSVMEILEGVDAAKAAARPISSAHSIWEIVLHIAAWNKAATRRLTGDRAKLSEEENFPSTGDGSEGAWQQTLEVLRKDHNELHEAIGVLDAARLDEPILEGMTSAYGTLHGVVQHNLYHAGQIAILKKA